jgi:hypothetical protein
MRRHSKLGGAERVFPDRLYWCRIGPVGTPERLWISAALAAMTVL